MRAGYLIDTDWIIDHFNRVERTTRKLKELRPAGIAMSVISLAELYEGVIHSRDPGRSREALDTFLQEIPVLGVDQEICKAFGKERGRLRQQRKTVSDFDLLIASTRLCYELALLSNNRRHHEMIEGLQILSLP